METMGNEERQRQRMKTRARETKRFPRLLQLSGCCGKWRGEILMSHKMSLWDRPTLFDSYWSQAYRQQHCQPHEDGIVGTVCLGCCPSDITHAHLLNGYIIPCITFKCLSSIILLNTQLYYIFECCCGQVWDRAIVKWINDCTHYPKVIGVINTRP